MLGLDTLKPDGIWEGFMFNTNWGNKSDRRRKWERASSSCARCQWRTDHGRVLCEEHDRERDAIEIAEARVKADRERPLPRPAPLPVRTPTRFE